MPLVPQRQVDGLDGAGRQTAHALAAQSVLTALRGATCGPGSSVGGQREAGRRAGGGGLAAQIGGFPVERTAASAETPGAAQTPRGGRVQTGLPPQHRRALPRVRGARRTGLAAGFGAKQSGGGV